jgi:hypothetical protein
MRERAGADRAQVRTAGKRIAVVRVRSRGSLRAGARFGAFDRCAWKAN